MLQLGKLGGGSGDAVAAAPTDHHETGPWIRRGNLVLVGLVAGLALFSLVSISGAVVATGIVNVESNYKTVQHLDGGIVSRIHVHNGDRVAQDQLLVRLDDTAVKANYSISLGRMNDLLVQQARLEAERDRRETFELPESVSKAKGDAALARLIETQRTLFAARMTSHRGEQAVLRQRRAQLTEELRAAEQLLVSRRKEAAITARELAAVKPLYEKGFVNQQRYLPIQREEARLEGELGRLTAELAKIQSSIAEAELRIAQSQKDFTQSVIDEMRKVQSSLSEVTEQRTALEDKLKRIEVRAPRAGRVHALAVHTEGGVVSPGGVLMQIVPEGERLIVDAQLSPQQIDKVRIGQAAHVRFPAFDAKSTPRLEASVLGVSPAQLSDQQGRSYFLVQVALADGELARLPAHHKLMPGMPAEVYVETGNRSILSYFLKPLLDAMSLTFRES